RGVPGVPRPERPESRFLGPAPGARTLGDVRRVLADPVPRPGDRHHRARLQPGRRRPARRARRAGMIGEGGMNEVFPFPILDLNGDAFARGVQHGKLARDRIHRTIESLNRVIGTALSPEEVATILEECRQHAAKYAPDLLEEVRGIAEGAGIDEADIFKINCYSELWYAAELAGADLDEEGCSTLAFAPPATGGETLLHWNC